MIPPEFLANIIANKADDLPRLIAADWLEEHGEVERAEFIRVQCEVAAHQKTHPPLEPLQHCQKCASLREREHQLICANIDKWAVLATNANGVVYALGITTNRHEINLRLWTRGFVSSVECTWQDWLTHADAILKATPLERVRLTTMPTIVDVRPLWPQTMLGRQMFGRWPGIEFELPRLSTGSINV